MIDKPKKVDAYSTDETSHSPMSHKSQLKYEDDGQVCSHQTCMPWHCSQCYYQWLRKNVYRANERSSHLVYRCHLNVRQPEDCSASANSPEKRVT
jgi:hypothetical protein